MKNLVQLPIVILLLGCWGCSHRGMILDCPDTLHLSAPPEIGQVLPAGELSKCQTMTSPASFLPASAIEAEGVTYTAATRNSDRTVVFISTSDPEFRAPEGYRVGTQLQTIIRDTGSELNQESGWACYVALSSGWNAALPVTQESLKEGRWVNCVDQAVLSPEIGWFFRRE